MKVCDPCYRAGKVIEASDTLEFAVSKDRLDVCGICKENCLKHKAKEETEPNPDWRFIPGKAILKKEPETEEPKKTRGRPKKS